MISNQVNPKDATVFENEIAINKLQLRLLSRIVTDIPESLLYKPGAGHGHPPVWILGHLAISGEICVKMLGGRLSHPRWLALFGPGSSDCVAEDASLSYSSLMSAINDAYTKAHELATQADAQRMQTPHGAELLKGSEIETVGQLISHLLTSHIAFHFSQLSSCRRAEGHKALF